VIFCSYVWLLIMSSLASLIVALILNTKSKG
jgi:hypothetical protein